MTNDKLDEIERLARSAFLGATAASTLDLIAELRALRHVADIASDVLGLEVHFGDAQARRIQDALADAIEAAQKVRVT